MLRLALTALLTLAVGAWSEGYGSQKVVSGYYADYQATVLPAAKVNYKLFNHIDYFVAVQTVNSASAPFVVQNETNMQLLVELAHKHHVTVSISIGGWTGSRFFSDEVSTAANRAALADNMASFMKKWDFDGIDLDWEYPNRQGIGCNTINTADSANYLLFLQELRSKVGNAKQLSAAVSVQVWNGADGNPLSDVSGFAKVLDFITIMAYDIIGPGYYGPQFFTGPNGPLYDTCLPPIAKISGSSSVAAWEAAGFPSKKILLGLPAYGYGYTLVGSHLNKTKWELNGKTHTSYAIQNATSTAPPGGALAGAAGVDVCGQATPAGASWLYSELVSTKKLASAKGTAGASGYVRHWDSCSSTPFLFNPKTRHFIAYDDPQSYRDKAQFVKDHKLGGVNVFDMTGDTASGALLQAARSRLL